MKVLDMCYIDDAKKLREEDAENIVGSWEEYYEAICEGAIENIDFELKDIDTNWFIILDGSEAIMLKEVGAILEICWRGDECHIWQMDEENATWLRSYMR